MPGGEQMDIFTDKLSQKLTAQEIIKANITADTEELNRLKGKSAEYTECLAKMQKLVDMSAARLSGMHTENEEACQAVRQDVEEVKQLLSQDLEELKQLLGQMKGQVDGLEKVMSLELEAALKEPTEKIDQLCGQLEAQVSVQPADKFETLEENVHRECVKVYRNVQAVLVEESGKQSTALTEAKTEIKADVTSLKGKLSGIMTISVLAMIFSLISVVWQVLSHLNLLPF